jgi:hypothetical protein
MEQVYKGKAILNDNLMGFTKGKVYDVVKDYHDSQTMNWFKIIRDDGEKTLIHKKRLKLLD